MKSEALLIGRIFDDRGNRMSPSHARKGGVKYRYYLSSALLQGMAGGAGSVRRVPAADIEALIVRSVPREYLTTAEIERLMAAARKSSRYSHRDATMVAGDTVTRGQGSDGGGSSKNEQ